MLKFKVRRCQGWCVGLSLGVIFPDMDGIVITQCLSPAIDGFHCPAHVAQIAVEWMDKPK